MTPRRSRLTSAAIACVWVLAACGTGPSAAPAVDVTGTWIGTVDSTDGQGQPVYGAYTATFRLAQVGEAVTGSYTGNNSVAGTLVAGVSGTRLVGTITPRECAGSLHLSGTVREGSGPIRMEVEFSGTTDCSGSRVDRGTLTKQ